MTPRPSAAWAAAESLMAGEGFQGVGMGFGQTDSGRQTQAVEKSFPQNLPDRPVVVAGQGMAGGGRETFGNLLHAAGEAVFSAVADKNREIGRRFLQPAPHPEFRVA